MSSSYLFVLGRTPELAYAELTALFPQVVRHTLHTALLVAEEPLDAPAVMARLGGTVKLAAVAKTISELDPARLAGFLTPGREVTFGVSFVDAQGSPARKLLAPMKRVLEGEGIRARFVEARDGAELSSVLVSKQQVQELVVVPEGTSFLVAKTIAVQEFGAWNTRDYGRPSSDAQAGMLPPKVARMVANIAVGKVGLPHPRVYDPYCGMGTIIAEALMVGANVVGSDQSEKAVHGAEKNLAWLKKTYPQLATLEARLFIADAVHVTDKLTTDSVDAIVTEPFMGSTAIAKQPDVDVTRVKNVLKGLEKLYIGSLKEWSKILKPQGIVVMAFPIYVVGAQNYTVKKVIDMCETLGYTIEVGPIEYSRPQAVVKRGFYVLRKNS